MNLLKPIGSVSVFSKMLVLFGPEGISLREPQDPPSASGFWKASDESHDTNSFDDSGRFVDAKMAIVCAHDMNWSSGMKDSTRGLLALDVVKVTLRDWFLARTALGVPVPRTHWTSCWCTRVSNQDQPYLSIIWEKRYEIASSSLG